VSMSRPLVQLLEPNCGAKASRVGVNKVVRAVSLKEKGYLMAREAERLAVALGTLLAFMWSAIKVRDYVLLHAMTNR